MMFINEFLSLILSFLRITYWQRLSYLFVVFVLFYSYFRPVSVHCGDKFTTVIGHVRADPFKSQSQSQHFPNSQLFFQENLSASGLKYMSFESKLNEGKDNRKDDNENKNENENENENENDSKDKKEDKKINLNDKYLPIDCIPFSTVMNYHQEMDRILEKLLQADSSNIDNFSKLGKSGEDSSIITNTDAGNILLSLIARISELQVASLISPDGNAVRNIYDIDNYKHANCDVQISNKKEEGIVGSLPYGIECTNVTFRSLLSLLESNQKIFCEDIITATKGGGDKENWTEMDQLQRENIEEEKVENPKNVIGIGAKLMEEEGEKEEEIHIGKVKEKEKEKDRRRVHQLNESDGIIDKVLSRSSTSLSLSPSTTYEVVGGRRRRAVSNVEDMNQRSVNNNKSNNSNYCNNNNNYNNNNSDNNHNSSKNNNNNNNNDNIFNSKSIQISRNFSTSSISKARQGNLSLPSNFNNIEPEQHHPRKNDENDDEKEISKINEIGDNMNDSAIIDENDSQRLSGKNRRLFTTFGSLSNILTILKSNFIVLSLQIADANANAHANANNHKIRINNCDETKINCENYADIDNIIDINGNNDSNNMKIKNANNNDNNDNINDEDNNISCHDVIIRNSFNFLDDSNDHRIIHQDSRLNPRSLSALGSRGGINLTVLICFYRFFLSDTFLLLIRILYLDFLWYIDSNFFYFSAIYFFVFNTVSYVF